MEVIQPQAYSLPSKYTPGDSSACSHTKDFWEPGNKVRQPRECSWVEKGRGLKTESGRGLKALTSPSPACGLRAAGGHKATSSPEGLTLLGFRGWHTLRVMMLNFSHARVAEGENISTTGLWRYRNSDAEMLRRIRYPASKEWFQNYVTAMLKEVGYKKE
jgi:hypothetical protein